MAIDFTFRPGETVDSYNARIASARKAEGLITVSEATSDPTVSGQQTETREQKLARFKTEAENIKAQLQAASASVTTLRTAQKQGLTITPSTTTEQAATFSREIDQSPPAFSFNRGDTSTTVAGNGAFTQTQEALLAEIERIRGRQEAGSGALDKLLGQKPKPFSIEDATKQAFTALGLPEDFTQTQFANLQRVNAEILALSEEFIKIETQEQQKLLRIEGQPIPLGSISGQQRQAQRDFAIQKSGLSAQIQAKAAYAESLRGNFDMVQTLVNKTLTMAMYAKDQEISDWKWMFDTYKDEFDSLTRREQDLYDTLLGTLEKQRELASSDLEDKLNKYFKAGLEAPSPEQLQNMSLADVNNDVIKNTPGEKSTASDFQIVQREDGTFVRINKLTGEELPTDVVGRTTDSSGVTPTSQINFDKALVNDVSNEKGAFYTALERKEKIDRLAEIAVGQGASFEAFKNALLQKKDIRIDSEGNVFDTVPFKRDTNLGNINNVKDKWDNQATSGGNQGDLESILFDEEPF